MNSEQDTDGRSGEVNHLDRFMAGGMIIAIVSVVVATIGLTVKEVLRSPTEFGMILGGFAALLILAYAIGTVVDKRA